MSNTTQGDRIRALFSEAKSAIIVAPFIKVNALNSLLESVPNDIPLSCITRWEPREIANGVSDLEVLQLLQKRGNSKLSIVERLHAKLYIADDKCLIGSSNVTLAGFGEADVKNNIEVLVEMTTKHPDVSKTIEEIQRNAIEATEAMAFSVRKLADNMIKFDEESESKSSETWFPISRNPERAFQVYASPPTEFISNADRILLKDIAECNILPGLSENLFDEVVRSRLSEIPMASFILDGTSDVVYRKSEADLLLAQMTTDQWSPNDIWNAFVTWMAYFYSERVITQEVAEIALRRAQRI